MIGKVSIDHVGRVVIPKRAREALGIGPGDRLDITFDADYLEAVRAAALQQVFGGGIYHALLAQRALKASAEAIYTLNAKRFVRLSPKTASIVKAP